MGTTLLTTIPAIETDSRIVFLLFGPDDEWLLKILNRKQRRIREKFHRYNLKLVCLPFLKDGYLMSLKSMAALMQYQYPSLYAVNEANIVSEMKQIFQNLDNRAFNEIVKATLGISELSTPCLIRTKKADPQTGTTDIEQFTLTPTRKRKLIRVFDWFAEKSIHDIVVSGNTTSSETQILFHASRDMQLSQDVPAEDESSISELVNELKESENSRMLAQVFLNMLNGYKNKESELYKLIQPFLDSVSESKHKPTLSRIIIDHHFKIRLPDFGNCEIQMTPLQKTLYLFFLKHPEGVLLVNLPDYRKEIASIYYTLSGRDDMEQIEQSIDELISPIGNSVHEKISRIRAAFRQIMDDSTAKYYYVSGGRGAPQKISLPKDLIDLQF